MGDWGALEGRPKTTFITSPTWHGSHGASQAQVTSLAGQLGWPLPVPVREVGPSNPQPHVASLARPCGSELCPISPSTYTATSTSISIVKRLFWGRAS